MSDKVEREREREINKKRERENRWVDLERKFVINSMNL